MTTTLIQTPIIKDLRQIADDLGIIDSLRAARRSAIILRDSRHARRARAQMVVNYLTEAIDLLAVDNTTGAS